MLETPGITSTQEAVNRVGAFLQGLLSPRGMERFHLRDALSTIEEEHASTIQKSQSQETAHDQLFNEVDGIHVGFGASSPQSRLRTIWTPVSHRCDVDKGDVSLLRLPKCCGVKYDQDANEIKGTPVGLAMVEEKRVEIDQQQSPSNITLSAEQGQTLIALRRKLSYEQHDFFLASQHSMILDPLRRFMTGYAMRAGMWQHGIDSFLDLSRPPLKESLEQTWAFGDPTYSIAAAPSMATVLEMPIPWFEWLRKFVQYQMVREDTIDWCARAETWVKSFSPYPERYPVSGTLKEAERFPEHDRHRFDLAAWFFSESENPRAPQKTPPASYFESTLQRLWGQLESSWRYLCTWRLDTSMSVSQATTRHAIRKITDFLNKAQVCRISGSHGSPPQSRQLISMLLMSSYVSNVNAELGNLDRPGVSGHGAEIVLHWLLAAILAAITILVGYYTARRQRRQRRLSEQANVPQIAAFCSNFANFGVSAGDASGPVLLFVGLTSAGNLLVFWHDVFSGRDPRHIWLIASFFGALLITVFMCSDGGNTSGNGASLPFAAILYAFMFGFIWVCSWALPERNEVNRAGEEDVEHATGPTLPQDSESISAASIAEVQPGLTRLTELMGSV